MVTVTLHNKKRQSVTLTKKTKQGRYACLSETISLEANHGDVVWRRNGRPIVN
ncbi:hypothetical protein D3C75_356490 [compost metagenome]|jgi:hypothetical protein